MSDTSNNFFFKEVVPKLENLLEKFVMLVITTIYFFYVYYKKCKAQEFDDFITFLDRLEWFLLRKMEVLANDIEKNISQLNQKSIADKSKNKF